MSSIFIAHAPEEEAPAAGVAEALKAAGHDASRGDSAVEDIDGADLAIIIWSERSVEDSRVVDLADRAKARGNYFGLRIDEVALPFGFGGLQTIDLPGWRGSASDPRVQQVVDAVRARLSGSSSGYEALPTLPDAPAKQSDGRKFAGIAVAAVLIALGAAAFFLMRGDEATPRDRLAAQFATMPCAWLGIDPVENGENGKLALTGVAADPAKAGEAVRAFTRAEQMGIDTVSIEKIARIDPRECAAIDAPIKLRKDLGGRLRVTGEPFILNTKVMPNQALVRVQIALRDQDKSMALLGIEPSGEVTWSIPDLAAMDALKNYDVGLVKAGDKAWEFTIYPDHLGWTGLLLVAGDSPLAQQLDQGTVQDADAFARTIAAATAKGQWDAEMVWFRIDPDPAG